MSEEVKFCPSCGKQLGAGAVMCPSCGHMFGTAQTQGKTLESEGVLKEGLMMVFIGLLIELVAPVMGFFGTGIWGTILTAIGAFIGAGGIVVEIIGIYKIRHLYPGFQKSWTHFIGSIVCTGGYGITALIIFLIIASLNYYSYGALVPLLFITIGLYVAASIFYILRILSLMRGCAEFSLDKGDNMHAEKCRFAGSFFSIIKGISLAVMALTIILAVLSIASIYGASYGAGVGLLMAAVVFFVINIIITCVLLAAQILVIIRTYQTHSKCMASSSAYGGQGYNSGNYSGNNYGAGSFSQGNNAANGQAPNGAAFNGRTDGPAYDPVNGNNMGNAGGTAGSPGSFAGGAAGAAGAAAAAGGAAGAAGAAEAAGVANAAGTAGTAATGAANTAGRSGSAATSGTAEKVRKTSHTAPLTDEEPVTMLKRPDAEIEFSPGAGAEEDDGKTFLLEASHPFLVRLSTGEKVEIGKDIFVMGRSREKAEYRVDDPAVSSRHVQLTNQGGTLYAEDLNSSNHTFVNGTQLTPGIEGKVSLKDGDILKLAEEEFKVSVPDCPGAVSGNAKSIFKVRINDNDKEINIDKNEFTIGRSGGTADLKLSNDNTMGRLHARIRADVDKGQLYVRDEDSANGTFINGKRLDKGEEAALNNGDELRLSNVTIRIHI